MEKYISNQKRYYYLDYYLKELFGKKVFKVALNGNFTCPNRDGKISSNGCIFCSEKGSGDFAGNPTDNLSTQFLSRTTLLHNKWPDALYIVYFQANTNTYGPLTKIKQLFDEAIALDKKIVALSIATRPDCLNDEVIAYLSMLNKRIPVWVELGLQTIYDKTGLFINRGYQTQIFNAATRKLRACGIEVIVHIINGLPGETKEMMVETVKYLNDLDIQGIKIHSLCILKNTTLADIYYKDGFSLLSMEEYVDITCEQLANLRSDIVIHRINGDAPSDLLIEPKWTMKKLVVMNEIDKQMKKMGFYQGCRL